MEIIMDSFMGLGVSWSDYRPRRRGLDLENGSTLVRKTDRKVADLIKNVDINRLDEA